MALDQIFAVVKEYFPATLGAIIGAWNKRQTSSFSFSTIKEMNVSGKLLVTCIAVVAIIIGVCLGKWVSIALVGYYDIPSYAIHLIEFVTALNGIKLVDSVIKAVDKSLDVISDKVPKAVSVIVDVLTNKVKSFFD